MSEYDHTDTIMVYPQDWAQLRQAAGRNRPIEMQTVCLCVHSLDVRMSLVEDAIRRISALERAKASQPAPEKPPTPAAGVESVEAFTLRTNSLMTYERIEHQKIRDCIISKAARERAIGECIQAIADSVKGQAMTRDQCWGIDFATAAIRTLANKEQPREQ